MAEEDRAYNNRFDYRTIPETTETKDLIRMLRWADKNKRKDIAYKLAQAGGESAFGELRRMTEGKRIFPIWVLLWFLHYGLNDQLNGVDAILELDRPDADRYVANLGACKMTMSSDVAGYGTPDFYNIKHPLRERIEQYSLCELPENSLVLDENLYLIKDGTRFFARTTEARILKTAIHVAMRRIEARKKEGDSYREGKI